MHRIISGLAGTGKSTKLQQIVKDRIVKNEINAEGVIYLCFNKDLQIKARRNIDFLDDDQIRTIHSLCFCILKENKGLPDVFKNKSYDFDARVTKDIKTKDFDELIKRVLQLKDIKIKKYLSKLDFIVIDEYQDFREDSVLVIRKLIDIYHANVLIGIDPFQKIYSFQNKNSKFKINDNYKSIEEDLGIVIDNKIVLRKNYRCNNPATLKCINGMINNCFKMSEDYSYSIEVEPIKNRFRKPVFRWFKHQSNEMSFVFSEIIKQKIGHRIVILSRWNRDLQIYKKHMNKNNDFLEYDITVSTIHKYKGLESDIVFVVGYNPVDSKDIDRLNIFYVAITRARERLYITSAYPKSEIIFDPETLDYKNTSYSKVKPFKQLPKIKNNKNFTLKKLERSLIDSVRFRVAMDKAPYCKYVQNSKVKPVNFMNTSIIEDPEVNHTIRFHHAHKNYYFDFSDLSKLHKNGYNDIQIVKQCLNIVLRYFDYRVSLEDIELYSIDLNKYFKFDTEIEMVNKLDYALDHFRESKSRSIYDSYRYNAIDYLTDRAGYPDWFNSTLYINHQSQNSYGLTTAIYAVTTKRLRERDKDHDNRESLLVRIDNLFKVELRLKGSSYLCTKGVFGKSMLGNELIEYIETEGLDSLYQRLFYGYDELISRLEDVQS